jgi:hypothetical protein
MARITVHSGQFIVGSVTNNRRSLAPEGCFSISQAPHIHTEYKDALLEAQRLAKEYPDKKFIVLAIVAVAQVNSNPVAITYSL